MSSLAQLGAKRQKALASTGPETEEGKQRSSLNATSYGFTGQQIVVSTRENAAYEDYCLVYLDQPRHVADDAEKRGTRHNPRRHCPVLQTDRDPRNLLTTRRRRNPRRFEELVAKREEELHKSAPASKPRTNRSTLREFGFVHSLPELEAFLTWRARRASAKKSIRK